MPSFLRRRGDEVEAAHQSDRYSAAERRDALHRLRGCVVVVRHPYDRDTASGAGNCWCGRHEGSALHSVLLEPGPTGEAEQP